MLTDPVHVLRPRDNRLDLGCALVAVAEIPANLPHWHTQLCHPCASSMAQHMGRNVRSLDFHRLAIPLQFNGVVEAGPHRRGGEALLYTSLVRHRYSPRSRVARRVPGRGAGWRQPVTRSGHGAVRRDLGSSVGLIIAGIARCPCVRAAPRDNALRLPHPLGWHPTGPLDRRLIA